MSFVVLASIILFGLSHGLNPSHGWPIAVLYSMRTKKPFVSGFTTSSIIAGAHFVSSITVVLAYIIVFNLIEIPQIYLRYGAAIGLGILAVIFGKRNRRIMFKPNMVICITKTLTQNMIPDMNIYIGIRMLVIIHISILIK
jgi:ABC-type nickel/cobalt efflux system permease component RcnA